MVSIEKRQIKCYKLLMNYINSKHPNWLVKYLSKVDNRGYTCLHYAISSFEILNDLIKYKVQLDVITRTEKYYIYIKN